MPNSNSAEAFAGEADVIRARGHSLAPDPALTIGYCIHQAPGPFLAVQPTTEMAKRLS